MRVVAATAFICAVVVVAGFFDAQSGGSGTCAIKDCGYPAVIHCRGHDIGRLSCAPGDGRMWDYDLREVIVTPTSGYITCISVSTSSFEEAGPPCAITCYSAQPLRCRENAAG